ncbi:MAG TPA: hypothetical protein VFR07_13305 [Mycobacteriales bacterium]|nr:hypothetical protein [Mycobacteriales bacterium]
MTTLSCADLREVRGAAYRADRDAVRRLLVGADPRNLLQHAGDALLAVGVDGLEDAARTVVQGLRARDWPGDEELAAALDARLGGPAPALRRLPVDLDEVGVLLGGTGGWLDLRTGSTWPAELWDDLGNDEHPDLEDDPDRWLHAPEEGAGERWRDRRDFAGDLPSGALRDRLLDARGAFRRFSRELDGNDDLLAAWRAYGDERVRGRARALLADAGLLALPPDPG